MPRPLTAAAAAGVAAFCCVVLTTTATSAHEAGAPCTLLDAKSAILASNLPVRVRQDAAGREGSGIDRVICRDLTSDSRKDMVASVYARAVGVEAWVFIRAVRKGWRLDYRRTGLMRAKVSVSSNGVTETDPVYRPGDTKPCCPTGGQKHYRFKWRGGKMVQVRAWHTGRVEP